MSYIARVLHEVLFWPDVSMDVIKEFVRNVVLKSDKTSEEVEASAPQVAEQDLLEKAVQYFTYLYGAYEKASGEQLEVRRQGDDIYVARPHIERRFGESLREFFLGLLEKRLPPHLLAADYKNYLVDGNYPRVSPGWESALYDEHRISLVKGYQGIITALNQELINRGIGAHILRTTVDDHFAGDAPAEVRDAMQKFESEAYRGYDTKRIQDTIKVTKDIIFAIEQKKIGNGLLHSFELLLAVLSDPKRHDLGIKILGLIRAYDASGKLELPFFFGDLMTAAYGTDDPLFVPLMDLFERPGGEELFQNFLVRLYLEADESTRDLIGNLLYIAVMDKLNKPRIALIKEALKMVTTRPEEMRRIHALLSDPREKQEIDKAESVDEYKRGLEARKKSGDGQGGSGSSVPPVSPATPAPSSSSPPSGEQMASDYQIVTDFGKIDDDDESGKREGTAKHYGATHVARSVHMGKVIYLNRSPQLGPVHAAAFIQRGARVFRPLMR